MLGWELFRLGGAYSRGLIRGFTVLKTIPISWNASLDGFGVLQYFDESLLRFVHEPESQVQSRKEPHLACEP